MAEGQLTLSAQDVEAGSVTVTPPQAPMAAKAGIVTRLFAKFPNGIDGIRRRQRTSVQGDNVVIQLDGLVRKNDVLLWESA
jgi:hypothetical protein